MTTKRNSYIALLGLTIILGLLSRSSWVPEQSPIHRYAGDALWALAVFWSLAVLFHRARTSRLVIGALVISLAIELTQLYHAGWIDHIRSYRIGALILGFQFRWADLACYTAGIWLGANIDHYGVRKERESPWNWWLNSTIKDKLIVLGCLMMCANIIFYLLDIVVIKLLSAAIGFLFIGFMIRSEDSTDI